MESLSDCVSSETSSQHHNGYIKFAKTYSKDLVMSMSILQKLTATILLWLCTLYKHLCQWSCYGYADSAKIYVNNLVLSILLKLMLTNLLFFFWLQKCRWALWNHYNQLSLEFLHSYQRHSSWSHLPRDSSFQFVFLCILQLLKSWFVIILVAKEYLPDCRICFLSSGGSLLLLFFSGVFCMAY